MTNAPISDRTEEEIENHRNELEAVAESDLPAAEVADALLSAIE